MQQKKITRWDHGGSESEFSQYQASNEKAQHHFVHCTWPEEQTELLAPKSKDDQFFKRKKDQMSKLLQRLQDQGIECHRFKIANGRGQENCHD